MSGAKTGHDSRERESFMTAFWESGNEEKRWPEECA